MKEPNPNGANQYLLDPRQKMCWNAYINPKSETFGNALQSALKAGYTDGSANKITTENWFVGRVRRLNLLEKAEKVLDETLELNTLTDEGKVDRGLHAIKLDAAKFVAETQGKADGYSKRSEVTGKDGETIAPILVKFIDEKQPNNWDTSWV